MRLAAGCTFRKISEISEKPENTLRLTHINFSRKMKSRLTILAAFAMILTMQSCVKEKLESTYTAQEKKIDQYIEKSRCVKKAIKIVSKNPETGEIIYEEDGITSVMKDTTVIDTLAVFYNRGASRLVTKSGEGEALAENGTVAFYYAGYVFGSGISSSSLFSTNHLETAKDAGWTLTDEQDNIITVTLNDSELTEGLKNGLVGVQAGEECQIIFSGKYGFGKKSVGTVPANSALAYRIWVTSVSND
mgnify:CR=1 FL=1